MKTSMLMARCSHGSVEANGLIYVCGGTVGNNVSGRILNNCEVYDPNTQQWVSQTFSLELYNPKDDTMHENVRPVGWNAQSLFSYQCHLVKTISPQNISEGRITLYKVEENLVFFFFVQWILKGFNQIKRSWIFLHGAGNFLSTISLTVGVQSCFTWHTKHMRIHTKVIKCVMVCCTTTVISMSCFTLHVSVLRWRELCGMREARKNHGLAVVNNRIYAVGGQGAMGTKNIYYSNHNSIE